MVKIVNGDEDDDEELEEFKVEELLAVARCSGSGLL